MITLGSEGPSAMSAAEVREFGRLAGLWTTRITAYSPNDGTPRTAEGAWEFGYALDGRAVIDVWQVPGDAQLAGSPRRPDQEIGLCVRIWDRRLQLWRFTFHGTAAGARVDMLARQIGDEMVMEAGERGRMLRWTFFDMAPSAFSWRAEASTDGGATWILEQEVAAVRAGEAS